MKKQILSAILSLTLVFGVAPLYNVHATAVVTNETQGDPTTMLPDHEEVAEDQGVTMLPDDEETAEDLGVTMLPDNEETAQDQGVTMLPDNEETPEDPGTTFPETSNKVPTTTVPSTGVAMLGQLF